jgi:hypothetical protein
MQREARALRELKRDNADAKLAAPRSTASTQEFTGMEADAQRKDAYDFETEYWKLRSKNQNKRRSHEPQLQNVARSK